MYLEYYQLTDQPFSLTPDPRFLYQTSQHREALNAVTYGITSRKGFICLTGEVGTGKTTLCRCLLRQLGPEIRSAVVLNPMLSPSAFLRTVLDEFGIEAHSRDRVTNIRRLNDFLLTANREGRICLLLIDEAQDLPSDSLELARLLSNLETDSDKLLQIVLIGQPELRGRLASPRFRQLAQRITINYHLRAMDADETAAYLEHRVKLASRDGEHPLVRFDPEAVAEIYKISGGTPRLVNALGDKALLAGYVHRTGQIDRQLVLLAASELKGAA
jgi:general secretion pathway protein A